MIDLQPEIDALGVAGTLALDLAAMAPGLGIPAGAIRLAEDVISIEQRAYAVYQSPAGRPLRDQVDAFAQAHGLVGAITAHADGSASLKLETRADVEKDMADCRF